MEIKKILEDIKLDRVKKVIIDTDTNNEVDDQFAIAYAIASDKIDLLSINAAPFFNDNSTSFENGMETSYDEIKRVLAAYKEDCDIPVFKGSRKVIDETNAPVESEAARNIIDTAMASDEPIYVLGIGACTNIASAIMLEPAIKEKIVVIWLGGNSIGSDNLGEFNLLQDYKAGQMLIDSGVPLVLCPAWNVTCVLYAQMPEFESELKGRGPMCELLWQLINQYYHQAEKRPGYGRTIWDVAAVAILSVPECADLKIVPAPIFTEEHIYGYDDSRHEMIYLEKLDRDTVYKDTWEKIHSLECTGKYIARWTAPEGEE